MTRLYLAGAIALALIASHGAIAWASYQRGADAAEARHTAAGIDAFVSAVQQAARAGEAIAAIGRDLVDALESSRTAERRAVVTVKEIVHANPDYAAVRRPAELQRLRHAELERITRAAEADRLQR